MVAALTEDDNSQADSKGVRIDQPLHRRQDGLGTNAMASARRSAEAKAKEVDPHEYTDRLKVCRSYGFPHSHM